MRLHNKIILTTCKNISQYRKNIPALQIRAIVLISAGQFHNSLRIIAN